MSTLEECIASGQVSAAQVVAHRDARELADQCICHPVSRSICEVEEAGETIKQLLKENESLRKDAETANKALHDAATSLNTIHRLAGREVVAGIETYMGHFDEVRAYANSRSQAARMLVNSYYLQPHVKAANDALRSAIDRAAKEPT
jgi:hypothetical protein